MYKISGLVLGAGKAAVENADFWSLATPFLITVRNISNVKTDS